MDKQILIAITLCLLFAGFASANGDASAIIGIGSGSGAVTLPISVTNGTDVGSVHVRLTFDPEIVTVTDVTNGDMDSMMPNLEDRGYGYIQIIAYQASNPGITGDFDVARVTFKSVSGSGSCLFGINVITFKDATPTGTVMDYVVSSGTYTATMGGYNGKGGSGSGGTYPPDPAPTVSSTITSPTTPTIPPTASHTSSPIKTLPGEDPDDEDPLSSGTIMVISALLVVAVAVIVLWRNRPKPL